jgi:VWFA-related protein
MRHGIPTDLKLLLVFLLIFVLTGSAQDFQIRARVDLVVVPVSVTGSDERSVAGLTENDFIVLEDGKPQTISNFSVEPVPLSAAVVFDTGLTEDSLSKVKQSFPALTGAFSDADELAVYRYDKFVVKTLEFTKDKFAVEEAMNTLQDIKPTEIPLLSGPFSVPGPVINGFPVVPAPTVGVMPRTTPHKVLNDAIFEAATDLAKRERDRRKIVLVVSNGTSDGTQHSYDETVGRLLETGIQVYAVGMDAALLGRNTSLLGSYAKDTGGNACFLSSLSALETCYARSAEQARNQYVLGYMSNNEITGLQPVFRHLEVRLTRRDYETHYRKGYYQYP